MADQIALSADARPGGDLACRCVDTRLGEQRLRRLQQGVFAALRIGAQPPEAAGFRRLVPAHTPLSPAGPPRKRVSGHSLSLDKRNVVPYISVSDGTRFRL